MFLKLCTTFLVLALTLARSEQVSISADGVPKNMHRPIACPAQEHEQAHAQALLQMGVSHVAASAVRGSVIDTEVDERLFDPTSVQCAQCHNGRHTPSKSQLLEISKDARLLATFILQGGRLPHLQSIFNETAAPETSLVTKGKYQGTGQCPMKLIEQMETEYANGRDLGKTKFIQSNSAHWLHDQLFALLPVPNEADRLWAIDTSYNVDGAKVRMLSPHGVYLIEDFLTPDEADHLIHANDIFTRSGIGCPVLRHACYDKRFLTYPGNHCELRTSSSMWHDSNQREVATVRRKVELLTRVSQTHYEQLQTSKYEPGEFFSAHYDDDACQDQIPAVPESCRLDQRRMITVLTYLNSDGHDYGGATYFPDLDLRITPKKGQAVLFLPVYVDGTLNPYMRHASEDAYATKFVAQQWIGLGGALHSADH